MAKIPKFFASPNARAAINTTSIDPGLAGSFAGQGMKQTGQSLQQLGGVLDQIAEEDRKKQEANYLGAQLTQFQIGQMQKYEESRKATGANPAGFTAGYMEAFNQDRQALLEAAPSEEARIAMDARLGKLERSYYSQASNYERKALTTQRLVDVDNATTTLWNVVKQNPGMIGDAEAQVNELMNGLAVEGVSADTIIKAKDRAMEGLALNQLKGIAESDPNAALDLIVSGQFNNLNPNSLQQVTREIATLQNKAFKAQMEQDAVMSAVETYTSGAGLDPKSTQHRKIANTAYEHFVQNELPTAENKVAAQMAWLEKGGGIMPDALKSKLAGSIKNGSKEDALFAAQVITALDSTTKTRTMVDQFDKDTVGLALAIKVRHESGVPLADAVNWAKEQVFEPKDDLTQARISDIQSKKLIVDEDVDQILDDHYGQLSELFDDTTKLEASQAAARNTYKTFFRDAYIQFGDPDIAKQAGIKAVNSRFGKTNINGTSEIMENAPEMFLPEMEPEEGRKKVAEYLMDQGIRQRVDKVEKTGTLAASRGVGFDFLEDFELNEEKRTLDVDKVLENVVVRASKDKTGGKPKYQLFEIKDGKERPIMKTVETTDDNGKKITNKVPLEPLTFGQEKTEAQLSQEEYIENKRIERELAKENFKSMKQKAQDKLKANKAKLQTDIYNSILHGLTSGEPL